MSRTGKSSKAGTRKTAKKRLQLPEVLDLTAAAPLAQSFLTRRGADLSIDASQVRRVGAQCLQVLLAAVTTWQSDGVRLCLEKPTEEFLEASRLLGLNFEEELARPEPA